MLDEIACTCSAPGCDRDLAGADPAIVYATPAGERRAYRCRCGGVTITVTR